MLRVKSPKVVENEIKLHVEPTLQITTPQDLPSDSPPASGRTKPVIRHDIQALRAIAVIAVVLFHINPELLPGGFVGVDMFFAISGFLITSHICASLQSGKFGFKSFYLRRALRLLPAAGTVIAICLVYAIVVFPTDQWWQTATGALASALYVQNWWLVFSSSDYFSGHSLFQHYWSLSVEEQFYIVWPLLLSACFGAAAKFWPRRTGATTAAVVVAALCALSMAYSVYLSVVNPLVAYLATPTRVWQFGAGALVALIGWRLRVAPGFQAITTGVLLLGVLVPALFLLNENQAVPGWITIVALLPVMWVLAHPTPTRRGVLGTIFSLKPVQYVGGISYSLYLWHWPVIIFMQWHTSPKIPAFGQIVCLVVSIALAALTKKFIEDPCRAPYSRKTPQARILTPTLMTYGLVFPLLLVILVAGKAHIVQQQYSNIAAECRGGQALLNTACPKPAPAIAYPAPQLGFSPFSLSGYFRNCFPDTRAQELISCTRGAAQAPVHLAVIGDSHALMWLPVFDQALNSGQVQITTYLRASCPVNDAVITGREPAVDALCNSWSDDVVADIINSDDFNAVVTSAYTNKRFTDGQGQRSLETTASGFASAWSQIAQSGTPVVVIGEVPHPRKAPLACLTTRSAEHCGRTRTEAVGEVASIGSRSVLEHAAHSVAHQGIRFVSMTDLICAATYCPAVQGGAIVYLDDSHLSAEYVRSISAQAYARIMAASG